MPGETAEAGTTDTKHVLVFYSSKTEPKLPDTYEKSLAHLAEIGVTTELIDVTEETERAEEHDVITTPTVIVDTGEQTEKHIGVVDGLQRVLEGDLYGQSLLHSMGFKEGRTFARDHDLAGADEAVVEDTLKDYVQRHGAKDFELVSYDTDEPMAKGRVTPDPDSAPDLHDRMEELLGGVFTEVFDTGVMGVETQCAQDDNENCVFVVEKQE